MCGGTNIFFPKTRSNVHMLAHHSSYNHSILIHHDDQDTDCDRRTEDAALLAVTQQTQDTANTI